MLPLKHISFDRWMDIEGFMSLCSGQNVDPVTRLTLLSDGSLTRILTALYLSEISVDVTEQKQVSMPAEMAKFLDAAEGGRATTRDAWLCHNGHSIVYAHSVIDSLNTGGVIQKELDRRRKPVGILLGEYSIPIIKDQLFIVQLKSRDLAEGFAVNENSFWARCYRLRGGEGFNASIFEVFSPDLFKSGQ